MIGDFENSALNTGYPCKNENNFDLITAMYVTFSDYSFASASAFTESSNWNAGLKTNDLMQIIDLMEVENQSDNAEYGESEQGYEFLIFKGKYKFLFKARYRLSYHQVINRLSQAPCKVFLFDHNKNFYGTNSSGQVKGFTVELLDIQKKSFGMATEPAWTQIKLNLLDPDEFDVNGVIGAVDFTPNDINLIFCTVTITDSTSNTLSFTVVDSTFGIEISGLLKGDFTLDDDISSLTVSNLVETDFGVYTLTSSGTLNTGTLILDTDTYYGTDDYIVSQISVALSNYVYTTNKRFQVDIKYTISGTAYTGLVLADFTMLDDTNGAVTILTVTEPTTGRYEITTSTALTTGDIDIDDSTVTGSGNYNASVAVYLTNFSTHNFENYRNTMSIKFEVRSLFNGDLIGGLSASSFTVNDDYYGAISFSSVDFIEISTGLYASIIVNRLIGELSVSEGLYSGSGNYDFTGLPFLINCGNNDTTDWLDTNSDGVGEGIASDGGITWSIIAPPYFSGNAQSMYRTTADGGARGLTYFNPTLIPSKKYQASFEFSQSGFGSSNLRFITIKISGNTGDLINESIDTLSYNQTTNTYSTATFTMPYNLEYIYLAILFTKQYATLSIDYIKIIEV